VRRPLCSKAGTPAKPLYGLLRARQGHRACRPRLSRRQGLGMRPGCTGAGRRPAWL